MSSKNGGEKEEIKKEKKKKGWQALTGILGEPAGQN
jgi:hypothetical protein